MRYVLAFITPPRLDALIDALAQHHVQGLSVSDAKGFGQEYDRDHPDHQDHLGVEMVRKLRVEIVCHDEDVEEILDAIYQSAHTGHRGDGKVFVLPVLEALRLKTGERGDAAIGPRH